MLFLRGISAWQARRRAIGCSRQRAAQHCNNARTSLGIVFPEA